MSNEARLRRLGFVPYDATTDAGYEAYGPGGLSRLFLSAQTNYCTNPSFEVDTDADGKSDSLTLYENVAGTPVLSRVAGRNGGYAQRIQYSAQAGDTGKLIWVWFSSGAVFTTADIITASAYIKGSVSGASFVGVQPVWNGSSTYASSGGSAGVDWTRFSATPAAAVAGDTTIALRLARIDINSDSAVIDVTIDDVLLEKSAVLTPYFDGSTADSLNANTYAWTGAANASTSTRAASVVKLTTGLPAGLATAGTIAMRFSTLGTDPSFHGNLFSAKSASAIVIDPWGWPVSMWYLDSLGAEAGQGRASVASALAVGVAKSWIGRWTQGVSGTLDLMVSGVAANQAVQTQTLAAITELWLNGTADQNTYRGPVLISSQRKSDAWTTAADAILCTAAYPDVIDLARRFCDQPGDAIYTGTQDEGSKIYVKAA